MSLPELVRYVGRCCAQRPDRRKLSEMGEEYGWDPMEVLAFLRCEKHPSKKMLRELARELDLSADEMQELLDR